MYGILGQGFGLYGYMPALFDLGKEVSTLSKYETFIKDRQDLNYLHQYINYFEEEEDLIKNCDSIIFARRPSDQFNFVEKIVKSNLKRNLFLEKPIADSLEKSTSLINMLEKAASNYRVGYSFKYLDWFLDFIKIYNKESKHSLNLEIDWQFNASHYKSEKASWKANPEIGGGAFMFYGSHIVNLLANIEKWHKLELKSYRYSYIDEYAFFASGSKKSKNFKVKLNANSKNINIFSIKLFSENHLVYNLGLPDPFNRKNLSNLESSRDERISYIKQVLTSINEDNSNFYNEYKTTNTLSQEFLNSQKIIYA